MGHTVIQIPVPAIGPIMQRLGHVVVCPHITLLGPFVDRDDVDENLLSAIREILTPTQSFAYELASVGRFSDGTVY